MKKKITTIKQLQKAIDNQETIVTKDGNDPSIGIICPLTGEIMVELYVEKPGPEPARHVYRMLDWYLYFSPAVKITNRTGTGQNVVARMGNVHWENGREYRLCGFTRNKIDEEIERVITYSSCDGKMTYARFELQPKETD